MPKELLTIVALMFGLTIAAGCGSDDAQDQAAAPAAQSQSQASAPASSKATIDAATEKEMRNMLSNLLCAILHDLFKGTAPKDIHVDEIFSRWLLSNRQEYLNRTQYEVTGNGNYILSYKTPDGRFKIQYDSSKFGSFDMECDAECQITTPKAVSFEMNKSWVEESEARVSTLPIERIE